MWAIQIKDDADTTGERTITATWTEAAGVFTFSDRFPVNATGRDKFIQRAISKRDNWQQQEATEKARVDQYLAALNTADPKGVK